ncbi:MULTISPECIES: acyltransferase [Kitasatospora]|uniref:Putative acyltransferase n=2 Tax=Kitasatospora setae TaxID=2066 RepID=E4MZ32_KITSK|nr:MULTISPECIES: acyltransferase [Kitasatospora]BAJ25925.1 putative acyltransferase [Kitasatospora setae KM-6054]BAJ33353.1 putative acyltransferase [Kitasatospora setae KM-6054]
MSSTPPATPRAAAGAKPAALAKLPSLTGLRFFAALAVFFFHSTLSNSPIPPNAPINPFADKGLAGFLETAFSKSGYLGVSFFFVLSGFVLAWASRPGERVTAFWRRRMLKIFPNHLVVFAASIVLFAGAAVTGTAQWLPNMLLVHTFFPQPDINLSVNPPSWSLGSELLFYVLFPLLIIPIRKIAGKALWAWSAVMVAGTVAVQLVSTYLVPATPKSAITPVSDLQFWFGYLFPPGRVFEFALGILLARIVMSGKWPRQIGIGVSFALTAVGYGVALLVPFQYSFVVAMIIPVSALICSVAAADVDGRRTRLRGPVMQLLGEISFGFYLVQGVTIFYLRSLLGAHTYSAPVALLVVIGFLAASLLGGWLLFRFVEMPAMRRWSRSRRPATATLPAALPAQDTDQDTDRSARPVTAASRT